MIKIKSGLYVEPTKSLTKSIRIWNGLHLLAMKILVALEADSLMSRTLRVFWLMWASFFPFCIWLFLCVHYFCRLWHLAANWMDYYYNCPVWNGCKMMIQYREVQTMLWSKINLSNNAASTPSKLQIKFFCNMSIPKSSILLHK